MMLKKNWMKKLKVAVNQLRIGLAGMISSASGIILFFFIHSSFLRSFMFALCAEGVILLIVTTAWQIKTKVEST